MVPLRPKSRQRLRLHEASADTGDENRLLEGCPPLHWQGALERSGVRLALALALALAFTLFAACKSQPSDLREWRASDHSQEEGQGQGAGTAPVPSEDDNDPMIAAMGIWQAQCSTCHGPEGRGDGPQASLTHPPDLTAAAFQSSRTDEQLANSITRGRNMMPGFGSTLRPEGIDVLVRYVRQLGRATNR